MIQRTRDPSGHLNSMRAKLDSLWVPAKTGIKGSPLHSRFCVVSMARTRRRLRFDAPPGRKPVRSSAHKAALRPLEKPLVLRPRITYIHPNLPPGVPPPASCVPKADYRKPRGSVRRILTAMLGAFSRWPEAQGPI